MHEDLEDVLLHFGKKGMKWGVRRSSGSGKKTYGRRKFINDRNAIENKVRRKKLTRKQADSEISKNKHKLNMNSKSYQKSYNKNLSKGMNHYKARDKAQFKREVVKSLQLRLATNAVIGASTLGVPLVRSVSKKVMTPDNIRAGKNIMKAAMRSNFRYVDGKKMTNVVNVASKMIGG